MTSPSRRREADRPTRLEDHQGIAAGPAQRAARPAPDDLVGRWPGGRPAPARRQAPAGREAPGREAPGREAPGREAPGRAAPEATKKRPLYIRLLRLRHIAPNAVQRALLGEGVIAVAILLVLADLASAWTLLVLPLAVAGVVKANDALAGLLQKPPRVRPDEPARAGKQKAPAPKGDRRRRAGRT